MTDGARTRHLLVSHNPPNPVSGRCPLLRYRFIYADIFAAGCPLLLALPAEWCQKWPQKASIRDWSFIALSLFLLYYLLVF